MADFLDTQIAQTIAEKLYDEVDLEVCERCALFEHSGNIGFCSLAAFEEAQCPVVESRLIQTRDSLIALLPTEISSL